MFEPVDGLAIKLFLDGNVRHGGAGCGAVPMLFTGSKPDDVARSDLFDGAAETLSASTAGDNDKRLADGMRVPGCARAGLKGDAGGNDARGFRRSPERINTDSAGEVFCGTFGRGLRAGSLDMHDGIVAPVGGNTSCTVG